MKGSLYFTVGLPRSGKSTYCELWQKEAPNRVIVSGDQVRKAITGRSYIPEAESFVFATMDVMVKCLLEQGMDVIIDETSTSGDTIKRYLRLDINAQPIFIECSASECLRRAVRDGKVYLDGPIQRMSVQVEYLRNNWVDIVKTLKGYLRMRKRQDIAV